MDLLQRLADPIYVAKFQRFCGVEQEKPVTCDQQTQTRRESSDSNDSSNEQEEKKSDINKATSSNGNVYIDPSHLDLVQRVNTKHGNNSPQLKNGKDKCNSSKVKEKNNNNNNTLQDVKEKVRNGFKSNYHTIEPSSRVHSKGSIFECKAHTQNGKHDTLESVLNSEDGHEALPPKSPATIKYKSLLYLAYFGAFLGNEEFYLSFFPFCIWNLDFLVVRQVGMLWGIVMYLGQATKDILRWPRPPSPPVVRLESHYIQEYSMPSTHAMAGTAIPLYLAFLAVERYQVPVVVAATVAFLWFTITCLSRLYLGVHTILDLLAGVVYSILIFFTFLRYVEGYDIYQQTHPFAAPVILFTSLALCTFCYPSSYKNSSKGDAVQIVAALTGCAIGAWLGYQLGYTHEPEVAKPYVIMWPTLHWCGLALLRFILGVCIVIIVHTVSRTASIHFFSYLHGLDKPDKTFPSVMTAYKFTTYTLVGIGISFIVPLIYLKLGIERPAMFYEVL